MEKQTRWEFRVVAEVVVVERIEDVMVEVGGGVSRCRVGRLLFIGQEAGCRICFLIGRCLGLK